MVAAAAILGMLLVACVQMLSRTAVQQRTIANRRAAVQMAANAMERAYALSWEDLDSTATDAIAEAVVAQGMLRNARVEIALDEADTALPAKRIRITVGWKQGNDGVERTQHLTAWRYSPAPAGDAIRADSANEPQP